MKKYVYNYNNYINEGEGSNESRQLKGIPAQKMIGKMEKAMAFLPDNVQFGVPSDNLGHSTSYKSVGEAIQRIKDLQFYYKRRGHKVRFYTRSIAFTGGFESTKELEKSMVEQNSLYHEDRERFGDIDLNKVAEYLEKNPEDADNFGKIALAIDSEEAVEFLNKELEKDEDEEETTDTEDSEESEEDSGEEGGSLLDAGETEEDEE